MNKLVIPGDKLASTIEYLPGNGVYEEDGDIFASISGNLNENTDEMIISVEPCIGTPTELSLGQVIIGKVKKITEAVAVMEIVMVRDEKRFFDANGRDGSVHVSNVSDEFVKDMRDKMSLGDVVQAKILGMEGRIDLGTDGPEYGIVFSRCKKSNLPLKKEGNMLKCEQSERTYRGKISNEYGSIQF